MQEDGEITNEIIKEEAKVTVDLQAELQTQLESMQLSDIEAKARVVFSGGGLQG